jgi:hypothetical protein
MRVRVTLRLTLSQYVLVSSPLRGHLTRYCFLFKSLGLEFVVLSLWGVWVWNLLSCPCGEFGSGICCPVPVGSLGLEFVVLSLWGALSDERPGLSFVSMGIVATLLRLRH